MSHFGSTVQVDFPPLTVAICRSEGLTVGPNPRFDLSLTFTYTRALCYLHGWRRPFASPSGTVPLSVIPLGVPMEPDRHADACGPVRPAGVTGMLLRPRSCQTV